MTKLTRNIVFKFQPPKPDIQMNFSDVLSKARSDEEDVSIKSWSMESDKTSRYSFWYV